MAPRLTVTADMTWRTTDLPTRCANLNCSNEAGEGTFVLLIEERPAVLIDDDRPFATGPPLVLYVCAPCAAVLRGEQR